MSEEKKNPPPAQTGLAVRPRSVSLAPRTMDEAVKFADFLAKSDLVPKEMRGKPANVFLAMQLGAELELGPMMAIQSIAVINGRPVVYGDTLLGLVRRSGLMDKFIEQWDESSKTATCTTHRLGEELDRTSTFSWADAEKVVLTVWENGNKVKRRLVDKETYRNYPRRMLTMRARTLALRDGFGDVLRGLTSREEVDDDEGNIIDISAAFVPAPANPHMPTPKADGPAATAQAAVVDATVVDDAEQSISADEFVEGLSPSPETAAAAPAETSTASSLPSPPAHTSETAAAAPTLPLDDEQLAAAAAQVTIPLISESQRTALFQELRKSGTSTGALTQYLQEEHELKSTKDIPLVLYDTIRRWCAKKPTAAEPDAGAKAKG